MTTKIPQKESINLCVTKGLLSWIKRFVPILIAGGLAGAGGSVGVSGYQDASYNNELNNYKQSVLVLEKEVNEQIIKTENLEARFVELRDDLKEVRGDTRQILVILTGTNNYARNPSTTNHSTPQENQR